MEPCKIEGAASEVMGKEIPECIVTTLFDVVAVLQDLLDPDNDRLVVATVVYLLSSGLLTRPRIDGAWRDSRQHNEIWGHNEGKEINIGET
jgi:hypothetical protein